LTKAIKDEKVKKISMTVLPSMTIQISGVLNIDFSAHGLLAVTTFKYKGVSVIKTNIMLMTFID
jgi:hypothetical protein